MNQLPEPTIHTELERAQARLLELEATLSAIRSGEVDSIDIDGPHGSRIFSLQSPDEPYRILAERMNEGAASVSPDGTILFCNRRLAEMVGIPAEKLLGSPVTNLAAPLVRADISSTFSHAAWKANPEGNCNSIVATADSFRSSRRLA